MLKVLMFLILISLTCFGYSTSSQVLNKVYLEGPTAVSLVSSPQDFSATWENLGAQIDTRGYDNIGAFGYLDINNSSNARLRLVVFSSASSASYIMQIKTAADSDIKLEDHYYEFNTDIDKYFFIDWDLNKLIPYIQFQIQASAVGATAGQIDALDYTLRWK